MAAGSFSFKLWVGMVDFSDTSSTELPLWHEPLRIVWMRRLVTIPGLFALTAIDLVLLPLVLVVAGTLDRVRHRDWVLVRCHLALAANLAMHSLGVVLLFGAWLLGGRWLGAPVSRERRYDVELEVWWARGAYRIAEKLFRMSLAVEGSEQIRPGPLLVFPRHASLLDILLPFVLISGETGIQLRYVVKRELLQDPCIDIIGHRVPFAFVRRNTKQPGPEIAATSHLADGLGSDAIVLYPEGTRFTNAKRARRLEELRGHDRASYERARRLEHLLPPRFGGPFGVLDRSRGADVLFMAHTGLEGAGRVEDLFNGVLLDATVRVRFWRVPFDEIPKQRAERIEWLYDWWERMDRWIDTVRQR